MARKKVEQQQEEPWVACKDCRWFHRDVDGISRVNGTDHYFMGVCGRGLHPDSPIKQFADNLRRCKQFRL